MQWLRVSEELPEQQRANVLRSKLRRVEAQIVKITGENINDFSWRKESRNVEKIEDLLSDRCYLLNQMFRATPAEIEHFERVNEMLYKLTQKLYAKTASIYRELLTHKPDPDFDDDFDIEGTLSYSYNSEDSVLRLEEDDYYGSNFNVMLWVLDAVMHEGWWQLCDVIKTYSSNDMPAMSDKELGIENWLDDGTTWAEGWLRNPALEHICICHTVHDICTHKHFSIPDLLRLNDFWCEVSVKHQHLVAQDGSHKPLY